jgi:hypothetical protein
MSRRIYLVSRAGAVLALLASGYCVLWIVSSASLACASCNCHFSLLAPSFRCRQPYVALLLSVAFLIVAVVLVAKVRRSSSQPR